jgi:mono/diheme cytochrome c family protein
MANTGIALLATVTLIVTGGQTVAEEFDPGKAEFLSLCGSCHGSDGKGTGPASAGLKVPPPDLTVLAKKNSGVFPFDSVYEVIDGRKIVTAHGSRDMPIWGNRYAPEPPKAPILRPSENINSRLLNQETVVRMRIFALIDYLTRIQER